MSLEKGRASASGSESDGRIQIMITEKTVLDERSGLPGVLIQRIWRGERRLRQRNRGKQIGKQEREATTCREKWTMFTARNGKLNAIPHSIRELRTVNGSDFEKYLGLPNSLTRLTGYGGRTFVFRMPFNVFKSSKCRL